MWQSDFSGSFMSCSRRLVSRRKGDGNSASPVATAGTTTAPSSRRRDHTGRNPQPLRAGAVVGEDLYQYVSGEFHYVYQDGHPFLQGDGVQKDIQGNSHTFTYDVLVYFKNKAHRVRPFIAGGVGAKDYVIAGPAPIPQPFPAVATLTNEDQWKFVGDVGGGVKFVVHRHVILRADFRDYLTTFPKQQIVPAQGNTARGIFQQFTVLFGVSAWF